MKHLFLYGKTILMFCLILVIHSTDVFGQKTDKEIYDETVSTIKKYIVWSYVKNDIKSKRSLKYDDEAKKNIQNSQLDAIYKKYGDKVTCQNILNAFADYDEAQTFQENIEKLDTTYTCETVKYPAKRDVDTAKVEQKYTAMVGSSSLDTLFLIYDDSLNNYPKLKAICKDKIKTTLDTVKSIQRIESYLPSIKKFDEGLHKIYKEKLTEYGDLKAENKSDTMIYIVGFIGALAIGLLIYYLKVQKGDKIKNDSVKDKSKPELSTTKTTTQSSQQNDSEDEIQKIIETLKQPELVEALRNLTKVMSKTNSLSAKNIGLEGQAVIEYQNILAVILEKLIDDNFKLKDLPPKAQGNYNKLITHSNQSHETESHQKELTFEYIGDKYKNKPDEMYQLILFLIGLLSEKNKKKLREELNKDTQQKPKQEQKQTPSNQSKTSQSQASAGAKKVYSQPPKSSIFASTHFKPNMASDYHIYILSLNHEKGEGTFTVDEKKLTTALQSPENFLYPGCEISGGIPAPNKKVKVKSEGKLQKSGSNWKITSKIKLQIQ